MSLMRRTLEPTAILLLTAAPLMAASPRVMYERALEREQGVRPRLEADSPDRSAITEAHRVVVAYERVANRYPGSGYTDNALWQAAALSADLWAVTGAARDRETASRLFNRLVRGYPSSSLVKRARAELKRLDAAKETEAAEASPAKGSVGTSGAASAAGADLPEERVIPVPDGVRVKGRDLAPSPGDVAELVRISRATLNDVVRVTLELDREVPYHEERIENPDRVFLDLRGVHPARGLRRVRTFEDGVVRRVRIGEHASDVTRVVLEVEGAASHSVFALYNPYRLVIDCTRSGSAVPPRSAASRQPVETADRPPVVGTAGPASADAGTPPGPAIRTAATVVPPAPSERGTLGGRAAVEPTPALPTPGPPAANLAGRFSLSRQLGLGIARIVIDPGHGGHDPGARVKGLNESDLVLDVALRLEQLLLTQQGVEVVMTRRTDVFIPLEERTAIANREGADLFLSIHANASRNKKARGVETYFLNFASNREAEAVAARENAASGRTMHSLPDIVKAITLNDKLDESRDFATMVQRTMIKRLRSQDSSARDLGVKQAPFVVLIGAGMPSILAEISFITNPQEARLLQGAAYRQQIAEALFHGVAQYQRSLKSVPVAASGR